MSYENDQRGMSYDDFLEDVKEEAEALRIRLSSLKSIEEDIVAAARIKTAQKIIVTKERADDVSTKLEKRFEMLATNYTKDSLLLPKAVQEQIKEEITAQRVKKAEEEARLEMEKEEAFKSSQDKSYEAMIKLKGESETTDQLIARLKAAGKQVDECPFPRGIKVFQLDDIADADKRADSQGSDNKKRMKAALELAKKYNGWRSIPDFKWINTNGGYDKLREDFPNFSTVVDFYEQEFGLIGESDVSRFVVQPCLLDGPPGIGKTAFAAALSKVIGLKMVKMAAASMQHGGQLSGSASFWGNASYGEIFNMVSRSESASGILFLDEVEKIPDRQDYGVLPALLDLMEPESARIYRDESLGLTFDASRLIVIMTSNDIEYLNQALLSRIRVFQVKAPDSKQRFQIAKKTHQAINDGLPEAKKTALDMKAVKKLVDLDIDIRLMITAIRKSVAVAVKQNKSMIASPGVTFEEGQRKGPYQSSKIGFNRDKEGMKTK